MLGGECRRKPRTTLSSLESSRKPLFALRNTFNNSQISNFLEEIYQEVLPPKGSLVIVREALPATGEPVTAPSRSSRRPV